MNLETRYNESIAFLANHDDDWARLIEMVGPCRHDPKAAREPYEALVRAIAYQQLTAKAGDAIIGRLKGLFEHCDFPSPEDLILADFDLLRSCGFSTSKIATIKSIAQGAVDGLVPTHDAAATMDDEALIERMISIKGVGRWTVEMLLMYSLERMDVLPVDDFGVREGYRVLKSLPEQPRPKQLLQISKAWSPHRTVAAWYLWRIPRERGNVLA
ncbi:DNA-3-methyladenine glycosylase II [Ochrobactrum sp. 19YEA23]|uniref:DNA-3-methyladenine glycosylase family protein n=1 Tax=Ochrobactrum sp. 19YEA23 TaxID=3039854 RepID=UPI0024787413|nr:DNA-3-methyladenine glycosylase II [Ochrobactrum sp. 19YEA23]